MVSTQVVDYIVEFLIGQVQRVNEQGVARPYRLVRYTARPEEMIGADLVIKPSDFFDYKVYGTPATEPVLPLAQWEGIPLLFGEPRYEWINEGQTLLLHADIIASSYYLMSRYEEMTQRSVRDALGRFPGQQSLPYRAGFIHRPIIDEYGEQLRRLITQHILPEQGELRLVERPTHTFSRINLSHDVTRPIDYRGLKGLWQGLVNDRKPLAQVLRSLVRKRSLDPYRSFDSLLALDKQLEDACPRGRVQPWLFLRLSDKHRLDKPGYRLSYRYLQEVLRSADAMGAKFGLLCSMSAASNPHLIPEEMKTLRKALRRVYMRLYNWEQCRGGRHHNYSNSSEYVRELDLISSRHSHLALGEPEDAREMLAAGIRHDYSMGYMDAPGFRLGTCRPVRFINPNTRSLTELVMHPLTLSAASIAEHDTLGRDEERAYSYAMQLIAEVRRHGGELNLSWGNECYSPQLHPWLGRLYERIIQQLLYTPIR
ncbi:MAG: hypothetical protein SPK09_05870 [Porphyromonas sp.]|nr:hypothetical protein [Porphyromonas sp.]